MTKIIGPYYYKSLLFPEFSNPCFLLALMWHHMSTIFILVLNSLQFWISDKKSSQVTLDSQEFWKSLHCSWDEKKSAFWPYARNHEVATIKYQEMPLVWGLKWKSISDGNLEEERVAVIMIIILNSLVSVFP